MCFASEKGEWQGNEEGWEERGEEKECGSRGGGMERVESERWLCSVHGAISV